MLEVPRNVRQKVIAGAAVAVAVGGGAFAAVSATGAGNGHKRALGLHRVHRAYHLHRHDLIAAAAYLGISAEQLEGELRTSKTLAQVAEAHAGKSPQGLIDAIVQARRARLAKAAANLPRRVGAQVNAPITLVGPGAGKGGGGRHAGVHGLRALGLLGAGRLGTAAADYLGTTPARLRAELRSGKTLAQIAEATPGRSSAGLVDALVAARKQRIAAGVAAGRIETARAARREGRLRDRIEALVTRKFVLAGEP